MADLPYLTPSADLPACRDEMITYEERTAWLRAHADDPVPVRLLDLMTIVGRLRQIAADDPIRESLVDRLCNSDLPRLQPLLPPEALEIIEEEER